jgi:3-oxo-5-alpha-steroid 4-dehydrogenase 1
MEIMATVSFAFFYFQGPNYNKPVPIIFALHYAMHYSNRGWFFPFSIRVASGTKSSFSITVALTGVFVTSMHGYLNAMWYSKFCTYLDWNWLTTPTCIFGLTLYHISFWSTIRSEYIMRHLRSNKNGTTEGSRYKIPYGFLFKYLSSPQYFTELTGFLGWAIMTWSPAGVFIFLISCANLIPRALETHKWYQEKFKDEFPKDSKKLIPFIF